MRPSFPRPVIASFAGYMRTGPRVATTTTSSDNALDDATMTTTERCHRPHQWGNAQSTTTTGDSTWTSLANRNGDVYQPRRWGRQPPNNDNDSQMMPPPPTTTTTTPHNNGRWQ
ncbi:hypothetical protein EDB89DRAFT_1907447 [Lactarius sanguifluus]|nr:hypothetical protein EDB89DRAFT_1907447 [Lactarius sanguifluus]